MCYIYSQFLIQHLRATNQNVEWCIHLGHMKFWKEGDGEFLVQVEQSNHLYRILGLFYEDTISE